MKKRETNPLSKMGYGATGLSYPKKRDALKNTIIVIITMISFSGFTAVIDTLTAKIVSLL